MSQNMQMDCFGDTKLFVFPPFFIMCKQTNNVIYEETTKAKRRCLPKLFAYDIPFNQRQQIWFQYDVAPVHFSIARSFSPQDRLI